MTSEFDISQSAYSDLVRFLEVLYREPKIYDRETNRVGVLINSFESNKLIRTNKLILYILSLHNEWTRCHPSDHLGLEQLPYRPTNRPSNQLAYPTQNLPPSKDEEHPLRRTLN